MTQEEIDELINLLEDPLSRYEFEDEELYQDAEDLKDRVSELLNKIKPH